MKKYTSFVFLLFVCLFFISSKKVEILLVKNGQPQSVIITKDAPSNHVKLAANELQKHILKASGAQLLILKVSEINKVPNGYSRILVGPSILTDKLGLSLNELKKEQSRIYTKDNNLVFFGNDHGKSPAILWAVCDFLDRDLGVRWLWPGELGTFVPKIESIVISEQINRTIRPDLQHRRLRYKIKSKEVDEWSRRHRMGSRTTYKFGHAFVDWSDKYHNEHIDYFAVPPEGVYQSSPSPRIKLNIGNPAVTEQILEEWVAAGKPNNWNVTPNDGAGWCTSKLTRALDPLELQSVPDNDIWWGRVSLTDRFIKFWNGLLKRMHKINPNATLSTYAYSAYREAPDDIKLEPGIVLGVVNTYHAYESWLAWQKAGAKLFLRPNWWHIGGCAPHLPLHDAGKFFKFTYKHSIIGFDFDSLMGYWGTQGPFYYLIARLSVHPEMFVDDVILEYVSAFGNAAPAIERYIAYWEDFTKKAAYSIPAGGSVSQNQNGLYEQTIRKHNLPIQPLKGGWRVMPYLYTDDVLEPALAILDEAKNLAKTESDEVRGRIEFLHNGLRFFTKVRNVVALVWTSKTPGEVTENDVVQAIRDLRAFGESITPTHSVWGDYAMKTLVRRGILTKKWQNLDKM